ncbi:hypothetical protein CALVIDRAFT_598183 [Calocera viscosa TUFC12733]|uniref:Protection of telomeres protein 1 n=1 Tax=Calocera viscosa (strain TUFC12733) TaxID=1330018 RepID=A0A167ME14_CALVF|nr:hypothetical protein CALVIDRAFT_598183 [Calocera viscosa TUFC12733]
MSIGDRKRKSTETEDERPAKSARRDGASSDPFDPSCEIDPAIIPKGFSPNSHITGTISSTWPANDKTKKFLLRVSKDKKLEVHMMLCSGDAKQLDAFVAGYSIALSLANADLMRADGPANDGEKLPFRLNYPKGALIKSREKVIDTRKTTKSENDWYDTPATSNSLSLDEAMAVGDSVDDMAMSPITEIVTDRPAFTQGLVSHDDTFRAASPRKSSPPPPTFIEASNSASASQPAAPSTAATESTGKAPETSTADPSVPSKTKRKRIRKRDTRHANNPALQVTKAENEDMPKPNGQARLQSKMQKIEMKAELVVSKSIRSGTGEKKAPPSKKTAPAAQRESGSNAGFTNSSGSVHPSLADLTENRRTQVAGIVVRAGQPKPVHKTGDWMVTYSLTDPSVYPNREFSINFFREKEEALPTAKLEEAMLVKQLKTVRLNEEVAGVGYKDNFLWAAYEPAHGREYTSPFMGLKMDRAELRYCHELVDWWRDKRGAADPGGHAGEASFSQVSRWRRPLVDLKDMKDSVFCDCLVQVVKIWQDSRTTDLYVTDYTENPGFGDPNQHNIVMPGKQALPLPNSFVCKITLWDEVNSRAGVVQPLQFYKLKNVRVRWGRGGNLEGSMGMGKDGKDALMRLAESDESLKALRKRKIAFLTGDMEALSRTTSATDLPQLSESREESSGPQFPPSEHSCVSGMKQGRFYTLVAEVVKVWSGVQMDDFYVTDYTEHPHLMDFSAVEQWVPPPGRRTLHVSVWDDCYRTQATGLTTGSFVRFEYMLFKRIHPKKPVGDGKAEPPLLGGKIGKVVQRPCNITILPVTDPDVKVLLRRKAEVMKIDVDIPDTQPLPVAPDPDSSVHRSPSGQDDQSFGLPSPRRTQGHLELCSVSPPSAQPPRRPAAPTDGPLRNIFHNLARSTLASVKAATRPDVWRVRARVVAFQPGRLRDWVWQECAKCHMEVPNNQRTCSECMDEDDGEELLPIPRWRFAFVLQDEHGETLPSVFCCDDAAYTFLGELPAQNLVSSPETLALLRARIKPLLGNLDRVQLRLLRQEEDWQRLQAGKGKRVSREGEGEGEEELEGACGEWADWTVRCWMDQEQGGKRWGVSGCRVVL